MNITEATQNLYALVTDRERQVIQQVAHGNSSKQVAAMLGIAKETVKKHRKNVLKKTGCGNIGEVIRRFTICGIIS